MKNRYEVHGNVTVIWLREGENPVVSLVDTEKLPLVLAHPLNWKVNVKGKINKRYYANDRNGIAMHRLVTGAPKGMVVDHINHNGLDNRLSNLRIVTIGENLQNTSKNSIRSLTGIRGLSHSEKSWVVALNQRLYYFPTDKKEEAIRFLEIGRAIEMPYSLEALQLKITAEDIDFYNKIKTKERTYSGGRKNKNGYPGLHFHKRDKRWIARVRIKGVTTYERRFGDFDQAVSALKEARKKIGL